MVSGQKIKKYCRCLEQLGKLLEVTDDGISRMATIVAVLHNEMDYFSWTGFYRHIAGRLIIGPYQGLAATQDLEKNTGVCWTCFNKEQTVVVSDVTKFEGHIACDINSRSEIVVPCKDGTGKVYAVLDVDSHDCGAFDDTDKTFLEKIIELL